MIRCVLVRVICGFFLPAQQTARLVQVAQRTRRHFDAGLHHNVRPCLYRLHVPGQRAGKGTAHHIGNAIFCHRRRGEINELTMPQAYLGIIRPYHRKRFQQQAHTRICRNMAADDGTFLRGTGDDIERIADERTHRQ